MARTPIRQNSAEEAAAHVTQEISDAAYAAEAAGETGMTRDDQGTTARVKETAAEVASQAREKAMDTAEQAREKTAERAETAAGTIRDTVTGRGGIQEAAGTTIADSMEKTASYLREHDTQTMMEDVERYVRDHPTQAILGALAVGFVIGRVLK